MTSILETQLIMTFKGLGQSARDRPVHVLYKLEAASAP